MLLSSPFNKALVHLFSHLYIFKYHESWISQEEPGEDALIVKLACVHFSYSQHMQVFFVKLQQMSRSLTAALLTVSWCW